MESKQPFLELKEDPPEATEAMIRYLYDFGYHEACGTKADDPCFHFDVCATANKYVLPQLEAEAASALCGSVSRLTNTNDILEMVSKYSSYESRRMDIDKAISGLVAKHLARLLNKADFCAVLATDDNLRDMVTDKITTQDDLTEEWLLTCKTCKVTYLCSESPKIFCPSCMKDLRKNNEPVTENATSTPYLMKKINQE